MYIFSSILTASGTGGNLSYAGPPGDSGTVNRKKHTLSLNYLTLLVNNKLYNCLIAMK
jgi:hypothetical protein